MKPETLTEQRLIQLRLSSQRITNPSCENPVDVVSWMGAIQAQDYPGAKWALAQRATHLTDAAIDQALADGKILRLHTLRPTWHFVTPSDVRWILKLTAPRVNAANAYYYRRLELDDTVFSHSDSVLEKALRGGKLLTRAELICALQEAGITATDPLRYTLIVLRAELDAVICSGGLRGKEHTYALLDERAPQSRELAPDQALAELTRRYFHSRGPATQKDYSWWSGLAVADARAGLELVRSELTRDVFGGQEYWLAGDVDPVRPPLPALFLLPNYDEYVVGYTDRSAIYDPSDDGKLDARSNPLFNHTIVIDGHLRGTWKRTIKKNRVSLTALPFHPFSPAEHQAFIEAAQRYGQFLGLPVEVKISDET